MSRKFSIVQSINLNKIHNEIDEYILLNNCFDPYIFMSEETIREIEKEFPIVEYTDSTLKPKYKGKEGTFVGYKVFVNNDLNFGIVEIR